MTKWILAAAVALTLAGAGAADAQNKTGARNGAVAGAVGGAVVAGPVGAVVGGVGGAVIGSHARRGRHGRTYCQTHRHARSCMRAHH